MEPKNWEYYQKLYANKVLKIDPHVGKRFGDVYKIDRHFCANLIKKMHDIDIPMLCGTCGCDFEKNDLEPGFPYRHNEKLCKPKDGITCYYCGFHSETTYLGRYHDQRCEDRKRFYEYIEKYGGIEWYMMRKHYENDLLPYRRQFNKD